MLGWIDPPWGNSAVTFGAALEIHAPSSGATAERPLVPTPPPPPRPPIGPPWQPVEVNTHEGLPLQEVAPSAAVSTQAPASSADGIRAARESGERSAASGAGNVWGKVRLLCETVVRTERGQPTADAREPGLFPAKRGASERRGVELDSEKVPPRRDRE